jgi:hypothetical protein
MTLSIDGVSIPDSKLATEITELVRDTASPLLFHHSSRVYYFGALAGKQRGLRFDPELLYVGAMFHDMGLTRQHSSATERFEVDGANAARDFLRSHRIGQQDIDVVWTAIALHTTPGIPQHMHPVVALVTAGVEMDVLGLTEILSAQAPRFSHGVSAGHIRPFSGIAGTRRVPAKCASRKKLESRDGSEISTSPKSPTHSGRMRLRSADRRSCPWGAGSRECRSACCHDHHNCRGRRLARYPGYPSRSSRPAGDLERRPAQ